MHSVPGYRLAARLSVAPGDTVTLVPPAGFRMNSALGVAIPRYWRFEVTGLFDTGMFQYDNKLVVMSREVAQRFTGLGTAVSGLAIGSLWIFLRSARLGKALRAVALNRTGAHLVGIPVRMAHATVMAISAGLAAVAGIIISPINVLTPDMGLEPLLMSFTIVILGGIGSLRGSLVAALLVGYAGALVSFLWSPQLVTFMALVMVFGVLIFRPSGLFGLAVERA